VQRLVKILQLRIDVRSEVGVGTTFSLTLPRGAAAMATPASRALYSSSPERAAAQQQHHVLLIEDDAAVLGGTRMLLTTEGYRVTASSSAEEALQRAAQLRDIDVIVSDFHLGEGKNGADAIASIRALLGRPIKAISAQRRHLLRHGQATAGGAPALCAKAHQRR
jgi:two-component system, sensor histidine kinase